jgi:CHASE3 domain sensor protein
MIPIQRAGKNLIRLELSLLLAAILVLGWLSHRTNAEFKAAVGWVTHTHEVLNTIEQTQVHLVDAESSQRGYVLTGRESYLEPYTAALAFLDGDLQKLKALTSHNPVQQTNIAELQTLVAKRLSLESQTIGLRKTNSTAALALVLTDEGKNTMDKIRAAFSQMREYEEQLLVDREKRAQAKSFLTEAVSLALIGVGVIVLFVVVIILYRLEQLQHFVTVCAWTSRVQYEGQWIRFDEYLKRRFGVSVSHGISREAMAKMEGEIQTPSRTNNEPPPG